jgi:hypothetical protein
MRVRSFLAPLAIVAALVLSTLLAGTAAAGGQTFQLTLTGAAEAPGPGDPDGTGTATLVFNRGLGEVCYSFEVSGVAPLAAAHIHVAPVGEPGPVVIPTPPTSATGGSGCVSADRELIKEITKNPENYYFNVHNADFPAGALRAQLG